MPLGTKRVFNNTILVWYLDWEKHCSLIWSIGLIGFSRVLNNAAYYHDWWIKGFSHFLLELVLIIFNYDALHMYVIHNIFLGFCFTLIKKKKKNLKVFVSGKWHRSWPWCLSILLMIIWICNKSVWWFLSKQRW